MNIVTYQDVGLILGWGLDFNLLYVYNDATTEFFLLMKYENDDEVLADALDKYSQCEDFYTDLYDDGEADYEFVMGINQWDERQKAKRDTQGIPSLVLNQCLPYVNQVINNIRQSRPAVRVSPSDSIGSEETAKIYSGIVRNIERSSSANDAYDSAAANAVSAGIGWIRICVDYASPLSFDQEIKIERVLNFQSAYLDPNSTKLDGSDAEYAFIFDDIPKEQFKEEHPDVDTAGFESMSGWQTSDTVRVAEYYVKVKEKKKIFSWFGFWSKMK